MEVVAETGRYIRLLATDQQVSIGDGRVVAESSDYGHKRPAAYATRDLALIDRRARKIMSNRKFEMERLGVDNEIGKQRWAMTKAYNRRTGNLVREIIYLGSKRST